MRTLLVGVITIALGIAEAGVRSGHARIGLLQGGKSYRPGTGVEAALRLRLDEGWHTYWVNPGEGGMPISVEWTLPEGWEAGPLRHPVPERFTSGGLAGFGYSGEVVFPVRLTAPAEAKGPVVVKAAVSWLACDAEACVPGEALLEASWIEGTDAPGVHAGVIAEARARVPQPLTEARLEVAEAGDRLRLELWLPEGMEVAGCEVYPATPAVVDDAARIRFREEGGRWVAGVERHAYASGPPSGLELVLAGGSLERPRVVRWRARGPGR